MPQHIVIVGGGVGGTIVANLLARSLHRQEAEITLIDSTGKHAYMPGWLYLPFNHVSVESDQLVRPERDLLNNHVHLVTGEVHKIDPQNRELHVQHNRDLDEIVGTGGARRCIPTITWSWQLGRAWFHRTCRDWPEPRENGTTFIALRVHYNCERRCKPLRVGASWSRWVVFPIVARQHHWNLLSCLTSGCANVVCATGQRSTISIRSRVSFPSRPWQR